VASKRRVNALIFITKAVNGIRIALMHIEEFATVLADGAGIGFRSRL
jgi:hypothetical protein